MKKLLIAFFKKLKKDLILSSKIAKLLIKFKKKLIKNLKKKNQIKKIKDEISKFKNIDVEYLEIRNKFNLSKKINKHNFKIFVAYYNKNVRLIDNY